MTVVTRPRLRSCLLTAALVLFVAAAWWYFAPTQIGGSTRYVVTGGTSMEPRFHTGDLAVVRPASRYSVGEIAAYWSTLLHVVVLHRIVAISGNTYTFKGDNNHFLDPIRPTRSELLGTLWFRVPHGGVLIDTLHTPYFAGALVGCLGLLALVGANEGRRRRRRRRTIPAPPARERLGLVSIRDRTANLPVSPTGLLVGAAAAGIGFLALCVFAFARPMSKPAGNTVRYTQQVSFGYHATVPPGPVYPDGQVRTGDPIFSQLVHRVAFEATYHFDTTAAHKIAGTEQVGLELIGPSGWTKTIPLGPVAQFRGDRVTSNVTLGLDRVQSLENQFARLIGAGGSSLFGAALVTHVQIRGRVAGRPVNSSFGPTLGLNFTGVQLELGSSSSNGAPASAPSGLSQSQNGSITLLGRAANGVSVLGVGVPVLLLRCLGVLGILLAAAAAALGLIMNRGEPFEESVRIRSRYGHLIVPVVLEQNDLGWPAVDVASIKALVRLAESGQRLILHRQDPGGDTFLVNDEGTVYRYQVQPSNVVWGDWKPTSPRPVAAAAGDPAVTSHGGDADAAVDSSIA